MVELKKADLLTPCIIPLDLHNENYINLGLIKE